MSSEDDGITIREIESGAPTAMQPGTVLLSKYRLKTLLGEGGMGQVFKATQAIGRTERDVAIKVLQADRTRDESSRSRILRECEVVAQLTHPNTIQLFDVGELPDGTIFLVMEFVEGQELTARLNGAPQKLSFVDGVLKQIGGSLMEAHKQGIVHRDLKPENILLTQRGGHDEFVKVLDFGIAFVTESPDAVPGKAVTPRMTQEGSILGTPPYMSPEQFRGEAVDARSDLYSLAVMAYEMLTGELPFGANTIYEWAIAHLTTPPKPFESFPFAANIPRNKRDAVMRALSKKKEERQKSVDEFVQEFEHGIPTQGGNAFGPSSYGDTMMAPSSVWQAGGGHPTSNVSFPGPNHANYPSQAGSYTTGGYPAGSPLPGNFGNTSLTAQQADLSKSKPSNQWKMWAGIGLVVIAVSTFGLIRIFSSSETVLRENETGAPRTDSIVVDPTIGNTINVPGVDPQRHLGAVYPGQVYPQSARADLHFGDACTPSAFQSVQVMMQPADSTVTVMLMSGYQPVLMLSAKLPPPANPAAPFPRQYNMSTEAFGDVLVNLVMPEARTTFMTLELPKRRPDPISGRVIVEVLDVESGAIRLRFEDVRMKRTDANIYCTVSGPVETTAAQGRAVQATGQAAGQASSNAVAPGIQPPSEDVDRHVSETPRGNGEPSSAPKPTTRRSGFRDRLRRVFR